MVGHRTFAYVRPISHLKQTHVCGSQPTTFFISCLVQKVVTALLRHQNLSQHVQIKAHLGRLYNGLVIKGLLYCYSLISYYVTKRALFADGKCLEN